MGDIGLSSITVAELLYGVEKSQQGKQNRMALEKFLAPLRIQEFNFTAALTYGKIRSNLREHL